MTQEYQEVEVECTPRQKDVIVSTSGPNTLLNVIAGPGSGKTRTLCSRVAYLMSEQGGGLKNDEILILSLTNRAVDDFRHKLQGVVSQNVAENANVMTFHSFAAEVLGERFDDWQLLEDEELKRLCELVPNSKNKRHSTSVSLMREIIRKARYVTADEIDNYESGQIKKKFGFDKDTFLKIRSLVGASHMFTYEDMLYECNKILKTGPVPEFVAKYKVIIVDEFQDVYPLLADMIIHLSKNRHLTISGDPNQSIYGFMGAVPEKNWKAVASHYPQDSKKLITLNQAFRSTPELIQLSNMILGRTQRNIDECVKSSVNLAPVRMSFDDTGEEMGFMYKEIKRLVKSTHGKIHFSDIAVLSFTNQEVDIAYNYFKRRNQQAGDDEITPQINRLNATPRWLKTQLSILLQYMKILIDPRQNFPLLSSLNMLHRVGLATVNSIYKRSISRKMYIWDYLNDEKLMKKDKYPKAVDEFIQYVKHARQEMDFNDANCVMKTIVDMGTQFGLKRSLITAKLSQDQTSEYADCLNSIYKSLQDNAARKPEDESLLEFYLKNYNSHVFLNPKSNFISLYNEDKVNFSTIHTAKGLEFPIVFLLSPNNFNLSNYRMRRVVYVGLTRASALIYFNRLHNQFVTSLDGGLQMKPKPHEVRKERISHESTWNEDAFKRMQNLEKAARAYICDWDKPTQKVVCSTSPPSLTGSIQLSRLLEVMGRNTKAVSLENEALRHLPSMVKKLSRK